MPIGEERRATAPTEYKASVRWGDTLLYRLLRPLGRRNIGDADAQLDVTRYRATANPVWAGFLCLLDIIPIIAAVASPTPLLRLIWMVMALGPPVYAAVVAVNLRTFGQLQGLRDVRDSADTDDLTREAAHQRDISAGSWFTWQPLQLTAIILCCFTSFFAVICLSVGASQAVSGDPLQRGVVAGGLMCAWALSMCLLYISVGEHRSVVMGATTVTGIPLKSVLYAVTIFAMLASLMMTSPVIYIAVASMTGQAIDAGMFAFACAGTFGLLTTMAIAAYLQRIGASDQKDTATGKGALIGAGVWLTVGVITALRAGSVQIVNGCTDWSKCVVHPIAPALVPVLFFVLGLALARRGLRLRRRLPNHA